MHKELTKWNILLKFNDLTTININTDACRGKFGCFMTVILQKLEKKH